MKQDESADVLEDILHRKEDLLEILLLDHSKTWRTKNHNILWATNSYLHHKPNEEIQIPDITNENSKLIKPRIVKSKQEQKIRVHEKAEIFTPKDVVHEMNEKIDWNLGHWPAKDDNWQQYIQEKRLEISCGEAPFIVSRYNAANGKKVLKVSQRVGFLDKKLQVINEFCENKRDWIYWTTIAFQSSYGYEWQGDNLLLARENLLYTFIDYWNDKFPKDRINLERTVSEEKMQLLLKIAEIISWNIFQMDGLKYVIPMSCTNVTIYEDLLPIDIALGKKPKIIKQDICPGCKTGDIFKHSGKYVRIMDWEKGKTIRFVDLLKDKKVAKRKD